MTLVDQHRRRRQFGFRLCRDQSPNLKSRDDGTGPGDAPPAPWFEIGSIMLASGREVSCEFIQDQAERPNVMSWHVLADGQCTLIWAAALATFYPMRRQD